MLDSGGSPQKGAGSVFQGVGSQITGGGSKSLGGGAEIRRDTPIEPLSSCRNAVSRQCGLEIQCRLSD